MRWVLLCVAVAGCGGREVVAVTRVGGTIQDVGAGADPVDAACAQAGDVTFCQACLRGELGIVASSCTFEAVIPYEDAADMCAWVAFEPGGIDGGWSALGPPTPCAP